MVKTTSLPWADCGVELSATFQDVGHGRYWALFGIHDSTYSTTFTQWQLLQLGQTSASFQLWSGSPGGDTFDRGEVTLYRGGHAVIDAEVIVTTVSCP